MNKRIEQAFNKKVYLLGENENGVYYWLEEPSWDCGWYWGFGYIETYTHNKQPHLARDIDSHSHADNFRKEWTEYFDGSKPIIKKRTFSEKEGWELSELFEQFYHLKTQASFWNSKKWKNKKLVKRINEVIIPTITGRILEILTPKETECR